MYVSRLIFGDDPFKHFALLVDMKNRCTPNYETERIEKEFLSAANYSRVSSTRAISCCHNLLWEFLKVLNTVTYGGRSKLTLVSKSSVRLQLKGLDNFHCRSCQGEILLPLKLILYVPSASGPKEIWNLEDMWRLKALESARDGQYHICKILPD